MIEIRKNVEKHVRELRAWLEETMDQPLEGMSDFFTARLEGYEEHMAIWAKAYERMAEMLPENCGKILDLGCGTGLELDEIFKKRPDMAVTGVDLCRTMLDELVRKHGDKQLELICADYFEADLGEGVYDAAISFETLHHFTAEKKRVVFEKIRRALKPGGVYIQADYIACCDEEEALTFDVCAKKRARDGIEEGTFVHFDTPLTLEHEMGAMRAAGFEQVEAVESIAGATFICAGGGAAANTAAKAAAASRSF